MAKPVSNTPNLPRPTGARSLQSLADFDADLVRALFTELMQHAQRINLAITGDGPIPLPQYTKGALPSPVGARGSLIYVLDDVSGEIPAFSDNVNWRRVTDRNIIS